MSKKLPEKVEYGTLKHVIEQVARHVDYKDEIIERNIHRMRIAIWALVFGEVILFIGLKFL